MAGTKRKSKSCEGVSHHISMHKICTYRIEQREILSINYKTMDLVCFCWNSMLEKSCFHVKRVDD